MNIGKKFRNRTTNNKYIGGIKTVVLENSGTFIDPYVIAPTRTFKKVFSNYRIPITMFEIRRKIGLRNDLHIREILKLPRIKSEFFKKYGRRSNEEDIMNIYIDFVQTQLKILPEYCVLLPKVKETIDIMKNDGIKIVTTTGFNREIVDCIVEKVKKLGIELDNTVAADEFPNKYLNLSVRPKPFMLYKNLFKLDAWPIQSVVKVDNTIIGIQEGLSAGCWSIGITDYSNYMNINSLEEWKSLNNIEKYERKEYSRNKIIKESGAHYVINEFDELLPVIQDINKRLINGETP